ncbi:MAG: hypothetical protein JWM57_2214 [Phycisphaerales bacterium]|nr:hypothetical protein [Phycisphaerales bacterium]
MPKVSVILPAYNAERYIRSAVESILAQTFRDFEFIIVNDGSTDGTEAILRDLATADARIKLISRRNTGYVVALLEAVAASTGEYMARMDGDDWSMPERFAKQVALLDARPEVGVVGTAYQLMDELGRKLHTQYQPPDDTSLQARCLAGTTPICHPSAMIRRCVYDAVGGYTIETLPAEDLDLWLRIGEVSKLACLPDVLLKYRLHAGSISETKQAKQVEIQHQVRAAAAARRGIQISFDKDLAWREDAGDAGRLKQTLKYGWWAFNSGERKTAVSYGRRAVRQWPTSIAAWKLLIFSAVKPLPASTGGAQL